MKRLFLLLMMIGGVAVLNWNSNLQPAVQAQGDPELPFFENVVCPFSLTEDLDIQCRLMSVVDDPDAELTSSTRLLAARIIGRSEEPSDTPILLMWGDAESNAMTRFFPLLTTDVLRSLLENHDVYVLNVRGTDQSEPLLNCPEVDVLFYERFNLDLPPDEDQVLVDAAVERCYERIAENANPSGYTIELAASDLVQYQAFEEIPQWHVIAAGSIQTRIALEYLRIAPDGAIASMTLDGVQPPDASLRIEGDRAIADAFNRFFAGCTGDCATRFPNLEANFLTAVETLNAAPVVFPLQNPITLERFDYTMTGRAFADVIYRMMGTTEELQNIPLVIDQVIQDDFINPASTANRTIRYPVFADEGLLLNDICSGEVPVTVLPTLPTLSDDTFSSIFESYAITAPGIDPCGEWIAPAAPETRYQAVESDIPVLILSGVFDTITPPAFAARAQESLSNSLIVEIPNASHVTMTEPCAVDIAMQFVNAPDAVPDISCTASLSVDFATE